MPGRKNPEPTEQEKEREHWLEQKRGYGDTVAGDEAGFLDEQGAVADVKRKREEWQAAREKAQAGPEAPRTDRDER